MTRGEALATDTLAPRHTGSRDAGGLEVATVSSDALRAGIRVIGTLAPGAAPLLTCVLRTHIAGGRRYLRVDLAAAELTDPEVIAALVETRRCVLELGGMLVFENAGPRLVDAVRAATLHVRTPA